MRAPVRTLSFGRTLLCAIAIEALFVSAAAALIINASTKAAPEMPVVEISLDQTQSDTPKSLPKLQPKVQPLPPPKPVPKVIAAAPVPAPATPTPPVQRPEPAPVVANDSPIAEPPAPVAPPPPPSANLRADREAEFAARVRAAIQAAVSYPPAARISGFRGRARVEFNFRDGVASQMRIILTSGAGLIDRAALAAVATAAYPPAPESLKGKDQVYQVTVVFELTASR